MRNTVQQATVHTTGKNLTPIWIEWRERSMRGYVDVFLPGDFADAKNGTSGAHTVLDAQHCRYGVARYALTIVGHRAMLDYTPFHHENVDAGMFSGIMTLVFSNTQRSQIADVWWQDTKRSAIDKAVAAQIPPRQSESSARESEARAALLATEALDVGQGSMVDAVTRRAIEQHAIRRAMRHYAQGWQVENVGDECSYDLHCTEGQRTLRVEVKGTTRGPTSVLVTANELENARKYAPDVALYVVHSIVLKPTKGGLRPSGGEALAVEPWDVDAGATETVTARWYLPGAK
jgi:hypothetical protein